MVALERTAQSVQNSKSRSSAPVLHLLSPRQSLLKTQCFQNIRNSFSNVSKKYLKGFCFMKPSLMGPQVTGDLLHFMHGNPSAPCLSHPGGGIFLEGRDVFHL